MLLRPTSFYLPSSSEIKIFFNHNLSELSPSNFSIISLTGSSPDLLVKSVEISGSSATLKTSPQNPRTYYLLSLVTSSEIPFQAENGAELINDKISRSIYFVGSEEFNPIRDRVFSNLPSIYNTQGSRIEDILSIHSKSLHEAQRSAGELLSDGFLRVNIDNEIRTRSSSDADRLANENVFKIKRVSKDVSGTVPFSKIIDYSSSNIVPRHNQISDIISIKEEYSVENILITRENLTEESLLLSLNKNIIKLLSLEVIRKDEEADCDGNIGNYLNIEKYGYLIKNSRYDKKSRSYLNLEDNQIIINPFTNLKRINIGDKIEVQYLSEDRAVNIIGGVESYEIVEKHRESVPTNSKSFNLSNFNIVSSEGDSFDLGMVRFFSNENDSSRPEEFRFELKYGSRTPSKPGEYSVDYKTGLVSVYGIDGSGTGDTTYICEYNYKRILEENIDYYFYNSEFVLNKSRSIINKNIYLSFNYENILIEGIHYKDNTHNEVMSEKIDNNLESSFSLKTKNGPVSSVFKIINKTTGEIYNPLYSIKNRVYFSGFRSPEIVNKNNESAKFSNKFSERMYATSLAVCPSFSGTITGSASPSKVIIAPPIPADLIDTSSSEYYMRIANDSKDVKIRFFSTGNMITSVGLEGSYHPPVGSSFDIGTKLAIIDLKYPDVLSNNSPYIGSIFNSSVEFSELEIFKNEKFFNIKKKVLYSDKNDNLFYLKSINSDNIRENLRRLRKVGDYGIDYNNGVIYLSTSLDQDDFLGTINYKYNYIYTNNKNIISLNDLKIQNPITGSDYKYINNDAETNFIKANELDRSYEFYESKKSFYNNKESHTCIVLDDYTAITSKDIYKINSIFKKDDVLGKDLYSENTNKILDISSDSLIDRNIALKLNLNITQNNIDFKISNKFYADEKLGKSVIKIKLNNSNEKFSLFNIIDEKQEK